MSDLRDMSAEELLNAYQATFLPSGFDISRREEIYKELLRRLGASGVPPNDLQRRLIGNLLTRWELMTNDFKSVVDEQEREFYAAMHELVKAVDAGEFWTEGASGVDVPDAKVFAENFLNGNLWLTTETFNDERDAIAVLLENYRKHIAQSAAPRMMVDKFGVVHEHCPDCRGECSPYKPEAEQGERRDG